MSAARGADRLAVGVTAVGLPHAAVLAALHAAAFPPEAARPWDEAAFAALLALPGTRATVALGPEGEPLGFLLTRIAADEAEILTLGVRPAFRRHGAARALLEEARPQLAAAGARTLFLEVSAANSAAQALYRDVGFTPAARRPRYYETPAGRQDALILRLDLVAPDSEAPGESSR